MRVAAIVVAAGRGERAATGDNPLPKQYRRLAGVPLLQRTIEAMLEVPAIGWVLPMIHPEHEEFYATLGLAHEKLLPAVAGGATRQASVRAGLVALGDLRPDQVLIQDAARPFVDAALVDGVLAALNTHDAALPAVPVTDTLKRSRDGRTVDGTEDRSTLFAAQTPQAFRYDQILAAHLEASALTQEFTDDAGIAEWAGMKVALAAGSTRNIKITLPNDFARAERLLGGDLQMETRVGTGFDVHPFEAGDFVTLGGVRIAHSRRLQGHSDADVALHALTDALYGALGEGDIGTHFPPSDAQWRGADSALFLRHAVGLVAGRGGRIVNLDLTLVCEAPRIGPHVAAMRQRIGEICTLSPSRVAVKATTSERLGFTGREEGIVAMATASVELPREG
jgi:2-C-methyl-D-erythritol 4-phosphate cytidylyltransferase/2-C-methyl-D-erythritol 2,4-cyclodiphosphate synthase